MATTTFERADGVTTDVTVRFSSSIVYRWTDAPTSSTVGPSIDITDDTQAAYLRTVSLLKVTGQTGVYIPPAKPLRVYFAGNALLAAGDDGSTAEIPVVRGAVLDQDDLAQLGLKVQFSIQTDGNGAPVTDESGAIILEDIRIVEA